MNRNVKIIPMAILNVLVFPGGTEIGLEIQKALSPCKDIRLFSAGLAISNHAPYVFKHHFDVPHIKESDWIKELNDIIQKNQIDYIFPAYDDVIVALAQNVDVLQAKVVSSPLKTCIITRSKSRTYEFFQGILPVPLRYDSGDEIVEFPVFVKPDQGQGSMGAQTVYNPKQLEGVLSERKDQLILEYLPGDEYTVDCFSDRDDGLLFCQGRVRTRIKNGISMNSKLVSDPLFTQYAEVILGKLDLYGAWFFQVKKDTHGEYKLLEIAPRVAGTMALNRVRGVNFPLLSIYEQERLPLRVLVNALDVEIDRALVNRYQYNLNYDKVYIDLDDTLILNDKVNLVVIRFIYQAINAKKKIILITKHEGDLSEYLDGHHLAGLFDQIIHLDKSKKKSDHILQGDGILIDDSFSERWEVSEKLGILTFDSSMVEMLYDDRV